MSFLCVVVGVVIGACATNAAGVDSTPQATLEELLLAVTTLTQHQSKTVPEMVEVVRSAKGFTPGQRIQCFSRMLQNLRGPPRDTGYDCESPQTVLTDAIFKELESLGTPSSPVYLVM